MHIQMSRSSLPFNEAAERGEEKYLLSREVDNINNDPARRSDKKIQENFLSDHNSEQNKLLRSETLTYCGVEKKDFDDDFLDSPELHNALKIRGLLLTPGEMAKPSEAREIQVLLLVKDLDKKYHAQEPLVPSQLKTGSKDDLDLSSREGDPRIKELLEKSGGEIKDYPEDIFASEKLKAKLKNIFPDSKSYDYIGALEDKEKSVREALSESKVKIEGFIKDKNFKPLGEMLDSGKLKRLDDVFSGVESIVGLAIGQSRKGGGYKEKIKTEIEKKLGELNRKEKEDLKKTNREHGLHKKDPMSREEKTKSFLNKVKVYADVLKGKEEYNSLSKNLFDLADYVEKDNHHKKIKEDLDLNKNKIKQIVDGFYKDSFLGFSDKRIDLLGERMDLAKILNNLIGKLSSDEKVRPKLMDLESFFNKIKSEDTIKKLKSELKNKLPYDKTDGYLDGLEKKEGLAEKQLYESRVKIESFIKGINAEIFSSSGGMSDSESLKNLDDIFYKVKNSVDLAIDQSSKKGGGEEKIKEEIEEGINSLHKKESMSYETKVTSFLHKLKVYSGALKGKDELDVLSTDLFNLADYVEKDNRHKKIKKQLDSKKKDIMKIVNDVYKGSVLDINTAEKIDFISEREDLAKILDDLIDQLSSDEEVGPNLIKLESFFNKIKSEDTEKLTKEASEIIASLAKEVPNTLNGIDLRSTLDDLAKYLKLSHTQRTLDKHKSNIKDQLAMFDKEGDKKTTTSTVLLKIPTSLPALTVWLSGEKSSEVTRKNTGNLELARANSAEAALRASVGISSLEVGVKGTRKETLSEKKDDDWVNMIVANPKEAKDAIASSLKDRFDKHIKHEGLRAEIDKAHASYAQLNEIHNISDRLAVSLKGIGVLGDDEELWVEERKKTKPVKEKLAFTGALSGKAVLQESVVPSIDKRGGSAAISVEYKREKTTEHASKLERLLADDEKRAEGVEKYSLDTVQNLVQKFSKLKVELDNLKVVNPDGTAGSKVESVGKLEMHKASLLEEVKSSLIDNIERYANYQKQVREKDSEVKQSIGSKMRNLLTSSRQNADFSLTSKGRGEVLDEYLVAHSSLLRLYKELTKPLEIGELKEKLEIRTQEASSKFSNERQKVSGIQTEIASLTETQMKLDSELSGVKAKLKTEEDTHSSIHSDLKKITSEFYSAKMAVSEAKAHKEDINSLQKAEQHVSELEAAETRTSEPDSDEDKEKARQEETRANEAYEASISYFDEVKAKHQQYSEKLDQARQNIDQLKEEITDLSGKADDILLKKGELAIEGNKVKEELLSLEKTESRLKKVREEDSTPVSWRFKYSDKSALNSAAGSRILDSYGLDISEKLESSMDGKKRFDSFLEKVNSDFEQPNMSLSPDTVKALYVAKETTAQEITFNATLDVALLRSQKAKVDVSYTKPIFPKPGEEQTSMKLSFSAEFSAGTNLIRGLNNLLGKDGIEVLPDGTVKEISDVIDHGVTHAIGDLKGGGVFEVAIKDNRLSVMRLSSMTGSSIGGRASIIGGLTIATESVKTHSEWVGKNSLTYVKERFDGMKANGNLQNDIGKKDDVSKESDDWSVFTEHHKARLIEVAKGLSDDQSGPVKDLQKMINELHYPAIHDENATPEDKMKAYYDVYGTDKVWNEETRDLVKEGDIKLEGKMEKRIQEIMVEVFKLSQDRSLNMSSKFKDEVLAQLDVFYDVDKKVAGLEEHLDSIKIAIEEVADQSSHTEKDTKANNKEKLADIRKKLVECQDFFSTKKQLAKTFETLQQQSRELNALEDEKEVDDKFQEIMGNLKLFYLLHADKVDKPALNDL